jgi:hypothetical protein
MSLGSQLQILKCLFNFSFNFLTTISIPIGNSISFVPCYTSKACTTAGLNYKIFVKNSKSSSLPYICLYTWKEESGVIRTHSTVRIFPWQSLMTERREVIPQENLL